MNTINRYLLASLAAALLLVVVAVAATVYVLAGRQSREEDLVRGMAMTEERARLQTAPFMLALRRLELARDDALARLEGTRKADSPIRFGHDSAPRDDGSIRSHADNFDPKWEPGIFVPAGLAPDEDLKHRIVAFRDTANLFGQAWRKDFPNLWFAGPEGWVVAYWPDYPWTEKLGAGDKPATEPWFVRAGPDRNAKKAAAWGVARTDPSGKGTAVTLSLPLYAGETFLGVVAQDVPLRGMSAAMESDSAKHLVFAGDGTVIAMTGRTAEIVKAGGALKAVQVPEAATAITAIQAHGEAAGRIRDATGKRTVLYSAMDDLPWTLATLVPDTFGGRGAWSGALLAAAAATLASVLVLALMARQLRAVLVKPLRQVAGAVASIAQGHTDVVLPTAARGEIAELAEALIPMRDSVAAKLDAAKQEKAALTESLAAAEQKAEQTQRRLDEEKVVAEDRATRLADLEQRYDALLAAQSATAEEAMPEPSAEAMADEAPAEQGPA